MPMKQIAAHLKVSPASVYAWTGDIELTPEQRARNLRRSNLLRVQTWSNKNRDRRRAYQEEGRARALEADALHQAGCMLYWAEGSKGRNVLQLTNSDVNLLGFFRRFVTECFEVSPAQFRMHLNVYLGNGLTIEEIERYWLDALELPDTCARKHIVDYLPSSSSGRKRNKLPYGVCTLALGDTRIVQHIYGAIQEYGGFEEPRWLD
jgi:hypothetical protein